MIEDFEHIDKLIRQKFEDFEPEPPERAWMKIKQELESGSSSGFRGSGIFTILTILGLIATVIAILLNMKSIQTVTPVNADQAYQGDSYLPPVPVTPSDNPVLNMRNGHYNQALTGNSGDNGPATQENTVFVRKDKKSKTRKVEHFRNWQRFIEYPGMNSGRNDSPGITRKNRLEPGSINRTDLNRNILPGIYPGKKAKASHDFILKNDYSLRLSLDLMPELTIYPDDQVNVKATSVSVGLSAGVSNFYVKSGIGFKTASDPGNYSVKYNNYLGTYDHVYEVTFDSTDQGVVPTYHTFRVDVYDTIDHYAIGETRIKNRYLEIPFLVGYRKDLGRFSLFAHGGVNVSWLVSRQAEGAGINYEEIKIIEAREQVPERLDVNWQLMLGGGMEYHLSKRLDVYIEPILKYYVKPEFSAAANPFGIGLRGGISYTISK